MMTLMEVFMSLPPRFEKELERSKICKRKKSLYGLHSLRELGLSVLVKFYPTIDFIRVKQTTIFYKDSKNSKISISIA